jgi:hypothetical protein
MVEVFREHADDVDIEWAHGTSHFIVDEQPELVEPRARVPRLSAAGRKPRMPDAVVIGAGQNGLAAAIRLAGAGLPVTVLEAADAPGGAVRTEELTLPGFRNDTYSAVYPATAASPVFAAMPLHRHGLEWVHPAACVAHTLTPDSPRCSTATWRPPPRRSTTCTRATGSAGRASCSPSSTPGTACGRRCSPASRPSAAR